MRPLFSRDETYHAVIVIFVVVSVWWGVCSSFSNPLFLRGGRNKTPLVDWDGDLGSVAVVPPHPSKVEQTFLLLAPDGSTGMVKRHHGSHRVAGYNDAHTTKHTTFSEATYSTATVGNEMLWWDDLPPRRRAARGDDGNNKPSSSISNTNRPSCLADSPLLRNASQAPQYMHVVFLGDSISRFLYLDLAYRLHRGGGGGRRQEEMQRRPWESRKVGDEVEDRKSRQHSPSSSSSSSSSSIDRGNNNERVDTTPPNYLLNLMIPVVQPSAVNSTNKEDLDPTTSGASNNSRVVEYVADGVSPSSPNAKKKKDWMKFFKSTLPLFDGHMRCDCSRDAATEQNIEHRFYQHPSRDLSLTYIQLLGSQPLSMRANLSEWIAGDDGDSSNTTSQVATSACRPQFPRGANCTLASKSDTTSLKWYFNRILLIEFVKLHLPQLRPRPTHVVMNIGLWAPLQQIAASMPEVLSSLNSLGVHVVWRATTQPAPVSSGMRRKGGVSQWLAMRNHRQLIDRVMRDKYCVVPPGVSRNDGSTNKQLLQQIYARSAVITEFSWSARCVASNNSTRTGKQRDASERWCIAMVGHEKSSPAD
ncbi:membrane-associated protein, putative [Bodo saltans]|uniref:Membrane-associated protein, putative n=1 Tax=Bodo saltans TaxID=75058 RepID=A0A0S4JB19_BODSA|nr:membrane-associated protein, putative [Bodo saltans]|eukprot:CUG86622.1 membrane-associated protein, putative [Bodo saltans]